MYKKRQERRAEKIHEVMTRNQRSTSYASTGLLVTAVGVSAVGSSLEEKSVMDLSML